MSGRITWKWNWALGLGVFFVLLGTVALPLQAATAPRAGSSDEQFFIISSVDLKRNQLVLKRPTEVTVLMDVNDKTVVLDEKGKPLHLKDLRAGDTVFVTSRKDDDDTPLATRIRKGYMTPEEVHRRYLGQ
jgi:hypothetical protein